MIVCYCYNSSNILKLNSRLLIYLFSALQLDVMFGQLDNALANASMSMFVKLFPQNTAPMRQVMKEESIIRLLNRAYHA